MNKVTFIQTYKTQSSLIVSGKVKCNGETFDVEIVPGGDFFNILFKTRKKSYAIKWGCTYVDAMEFLINGNIQGLAFKASLQEAF